MEDKGINLNGEIQSCIIVLRLKAVLEKHLSIELTNHNESPLMFLNTFRWQNPLEYLLSDSESYSWSFSSHNLITEMIRRQKTKATKDTFNL